MFSNTATIFSTSENIIPAFETLFWRSKIMFFLVQTTIGASPTLFSEAATIFFESEISFSIRLKNLGTHRFRVS
jgi:hypothetical protein